MRIMLINPPQILPYGSSGPYASRPLGLEYIALALMGEHEVSIYDATAEGWDKTRVVDGGNYLGAPFDEISRRIESFKPGLVGITVPYTANAESATLVAMTAKSVDRGIVTVLGGRYPTLWPEETVMHQAVNFVVIGEGEHTMQELARTIEERNLKGLDGVRGIAYKKDGKAVLTAPRKAEVDSPSVAGKVDETSGEMWGILRQATMTFFGI